MTPTNKQSLEAKEVRKIIDTFPELSRALAALYLEVEAGIAEDIEVKVVEALQQDRKETLEKVKDIGKSHVQRYCADWGCDDKFLDSIDDVLLLLEDK